MSTAFSRPLRLLAACLLALLAAPSSAEAEELKSKLGFYIDMPSGFGLTSGDGSTRFSFSDPDGMMEYDVLAYDGGRFASAKALADSSLSKLGSKGEATEYSYEGRQAVLAELGFALGDSKRKGYALFMKGRQGESCYALLAYAPEEDFDAYSDFILSCLDAFSVDAAALRSPGPVSQFTLAWPPEREGTKAVTLPSGTTASLPWSEEEARQEADTDAREYRVLKAYADEQELWRDAWARFYRMAERESGARLDRLVLEMSRELPREDPTDTARRVLAWVQGFSYERDQGGTDFVPPLAAAYGGRGDCDSRSVVAAIVLERLGVDAILMVSKDYSHAMLGVDVPGGGQRFAFNGKKYLVGETTAEVGLGMIAKDQADWGKWMGIDLR